MRNRRFEIDIVTISLFVIVALGLIASQVVLVRQNQSLKSELAAEFERQIRIVEAPVGKRVPTLKGIDIASGQSVEFAYGVDDRKTLLYVFTPVCPWCKKNKENFRAIASAIDRKRFRVIGIDLSSTANVEFLKENNLHVDYALTNLDPKLIRDYKLTLTPQTILIDASGAVEKVWTGLYNEVEGADLAARLNVGVKLPVSGS